MQTINKLIFILPTLMLQGCYATLPYQPPVSDKTATLVFDIPFQYQKSIRIFSAKKQDRTIVSSLLFGEHRNFSQANDSIKVDADDTLILHAEFSIPYETGAGYCDTYRGFHPEKNAQYHVTVTHFFIPDKGGKCG